MIKKIFILSGLLILLLTTCKNKNDIPTPSLIPQAVQLSINKQNSFTLNKKTGISINTEKIKKTAIFLSERLKKATGQEYSVSMEDRAPGINYIRFVLNDTIKIPLEGYILKVDKNLVSIFSNNEQGLFYGLQTLYQLLPPEIFSKNKLKLPVTIPGVNIKDYPRFPYRGMHLDVSRHFFPKEFIKKYIDLIAFHKMNTFHWHLVDDQGWRIEIKKYPKLTEIGAWRVNRNNISWRKRKPAQKGEKATYGGYYTQEDIREIVQYAKDRQITIIPEIEMPAHVLSAIASYPDLSCTGDSISVPTGGIYPVNAIYCAGKEHTFTFIENVLNEVIDLFPSKYIHIGGDEANKKPWEKCSYCQKRMKQENLKNTKELQSYFIHRIEQFLNRKGKILIGWDEILEGGLAPNATVMSWRGISGGIAAAKLGHSVIMTPGSHCYFDHYQGDPKIEPEAIGGYTTLKKTYSYEPIPKELDKKQSKYILGAQGNVWTEFILTPKHVEYMAIPRMAALAEVVWSPKEHKNWEDFNQRIQKLFNYYDSWGINYAQGTTKIEFNVKPGKDTVLVRLSNERYHPEIHFTLDGTTPNIKSAIYKNAIPITKSTTIKAILAKDGKLIGAVSEKLIAKHKAIGAKVRYLTPYSSKYKANGINNLSDGMTGSSSFNDGYWQGFAGSDMEVIIDFGKPLLIHNISAGFIQKQSSWIFLPKYVEYYVSNNGQDYQRIAKVDNKIATNEENIIYRFPINILNTKARFLKVKAKALINCPAWHPGAGNKAWIFADEITVE